MKLNCLTALIVLSTLVLNIKAYAHSCKDEECDALFSYSCQNYFKAVGRKQCLELCELKSNMLCEGFTQRFLKSRGPVSLLSGCTNSKFVDESNGWSIEVKQREDSSSLFFEIIIIGPSQYLGEHEKPSWFSEPVERYHYTVTVRPNWKLHYSFDSQMFSASLNKKGFAAMDQEGNRDTREILPDIYGKLDDEVFAALRDFFKIDAFPECEATRSTSVDSN